MKTIRLSTLLSLLLISACVTINVYFPTAQAEEAADKIIMRVYGEDQAPAAAPEKPAPDVAPPDSSSWQAPVSQPLLVSVLEWLVPSAQAAPDIDIASPAVAAVRAAMEARFPSLKPFFDNGSVGMTTDGLVTVRDLNSVPLRDRQAVKSLTAAENKDRNSLYMEIARANGHPEWEADIRATFARRWVDNAPRGWWYQDAGGAWKQK